jgi:hypothetical protein
LELFFTRFDFTLTRVEEVTAACFGAALVVRCRLKLLTTAASDAAVKSPNL